MEIRKVEKLSLWKDGFLAISFGNENVGTYDYDSVLREFILDHWTEAHRLEPEPNKEVSVYIVITNFIESKAKFFVVLRKRLTYWGYDSRWYKIEEKVKTITPRPDRPECVPRKVATATLKHERLYPNDAWRTVIADIYMVSPEVSKVVIEYEKVENDKTLNESVVIFSF